MLITQRRSPRTTTPLLGAAAGARPLLIARRRSSRAGASGARLPGRACRGTGRRPSSAARLRCFSAVRDVIMMIGMPWYLASLLIVFVNSKPSMRGISMSSRITSGICSASTCKRIHAVARGRDREALAREQAARDLAHRERVVDDHHQRLRGNRRHRRARSIADRAVVAARLDLRHVGAPGELHRIDDQHDLAGAEHGRAGDAGHARELRADVLHDDFLVADHLVDVDRRVVLAAAQEQDRVVALGLGVVRGVAEQARQVVERDTCGPATRPCAGCRCRAAPATSPAAPARPSARAAPTAARRRAPAPPARRRA